MTGQTDQGKARRFNTRRCACGVVTSVLAANALRGVRDETVRQVGNELVGPWFQLYTVVSSAPSGTGGGILCANGRLIVPCRGCGILRFASPVRGSFRADRKCDARCTNARGHNCECQCGGKNHGAGHEVAA